MQPVVKMSRKNEIIFDNIPSLLDVALEAATGIRNLHLMVQPLNWEFIPTEALERARIQSGFLFYGAFFAPWQQQHRKSKC